MAETFETTKEINKKPSTKLKIVAVVVLVVILAVFLIFQILKSKPNVYTGTPLKEFVFTEVAPGKYPTDFPKELILFKDAEVVSGKQTNNQTGINHKVAEYVTATPATDVVAQYKSKLPELGWHLSSSYTEGKLSNVGFSDGKGSYLFILIFSKTETSSQVNMDLKTTE